MRRSLLIVLLAVAGIAVALVYTRVTSDGRKATSTGAAVKPVATPSAAEAPVPALQELARTPLEPEPAVGFGGVQETPRAPGAGQALLRVEVVALEDARALPWTQLDLHEDAEQIEMQPMSMRRDRARGLDGDRLVTDARGRAEFIVRIGRAFTLAAHGESGDATQKIAPLVRGEERDVRLALRGLGESWFVRVLDSETEAPIADASVRVLRWDSSAAEREVLVDAKTSYPNDEPPLVTEGRTEASGRFSAVVPLLRPLFARVEAPGYHFTGCRVEPQDEESESAEAKVHLLPPASLAVIVRERGGRPAAGIEVRLRTPELHFNDHVFFFTRAEWHRVTDAEGRCSFAALPAAKLAVELRRGERVVGRPGGTEGSVFEPREHREVEWTLDGGCTLVGRAHDPEGKGLARVSLVLESVEADSYAELGIADPEAGALRATQNVLGRAEITHIVTDAQGEFALDDVGSGTWALGLARYESDLLRKFFDARLVFAVAAGATEKRVDLRLDPVEQIAGRVLAPDGTPALARVTARGKGPGGEPLEVSDGASFVDGTFHLFGLPSGEFRLEADPADPALCGPPPLTVRAGTEDVVLRLAPGATASVRVLDATGAPSDGDVSLFPVGATERADLRIAHEEPVRFENVTPGTYDVVACREGAAGVLRSVELRAPRPDELVLRLAPAPPITVRTTARARDDRIRVDLHWEGRKLDFAFAGVEPNRMFAPPGAVTVRWIRVDAARRGVLLHEASGVAGTELAFEYAVQ